MAKKVSLPRYDERRGWIGGDSRTLYAFTDRRTGRVFVYPGGGSNKKLLMHVGPEADVRRATRSEAETLWQSPLHAGWNVGHATMKYSPKASDKIGRTMHEFKHGTLKSGSGKKVRSRKQAIAIGISQARRAGYKVPPEPRGHATMSLDARVRAHLSNMRPGTEIDARGMARALGGGVNALEVDYALERAQKAGLAVTRDGRWFGPRGGSSRHARMKVSQKETKARIERAAYRAMRDNPEAFPGALEGVSKKTTARLEREIAEVLAKRSSKRT